MGASVPCRLTAHSAAKWREKDEAATGRLEPREAATLPRPCLIGGDGLDPGGGWEDGKRMRWLAGLLLGCAAEVCACACGTSLGLRLIGRFAGLGRAWADLWKAREVGGKRLRGREPRVCLWRLAAAKWWAVGAVLSRTCMQLYTCGCGQPCPATSSLAPLALGRV